MTFGCCFVYRVHFCLEFAAFFIGEWWGGFFLPRELYPLRDYGYWVFASHTVVGIVRDESCLLPSCMVASMVAVDDPSGLPKLKLIKELVPADSDFAYE